MGFLLSLPLWQGKVPPNPISGFRTAKTLADPVLWHQVNTATGRSLVLLNVLIAIVTLVLHFTITKDRPGLAALILTSAFVIGAALVALQGYLIINPR
ncbi:SdpI family protein [Massilia sp. DJPM01]|uniref:SdpI family protein n=1 Tax=Massilia sp. DJPM01 TaxID=3024404 RepID=UPI0035A2F487